MSESTTLIIGSPGHGEEKKPFWAKCTKCAHCWPLAYLPMDITMAAKLMKRAACPMCGDAKPTVAKQSHGDLQEIVNG